MPKYKEKLLLRKIQREYRHKGFSLPHAKHIANAVVYGNPKIRSHFKHHKLMHPKFKGQRKSII
jgi:hypothetical protein